MRISVLKPEELGTGLINQWRTIQRGNPDLASPCFSPEFTLCAGKSRRDAYIALLESPDNGTAFFPFHRNMLGIGRPIGASLSDFNGFIAAPRTQLDMRILLKQLRIGVFDFYHAIAGDMSFSPFARRTAKSPFIATDNGFDAYCASRREAGSRQLTDIARFTRRLTKEIGPVRFEPESDSDEVFDTLCRWKSGQYRESGINDMFSIRWARDLVRHVRQTRTQSFRGILSALYAGDEVVAAHFGMMSDKVWHYWFPAYRPDLARHRPGLILLFEMTRYAAELGLSRIDLGRGDSLYKDRLSTGYIEVREGELAFPSVAALTRRANRAISSLKDHPVVGQPVRILKALGHRIRSRI